MQVQNNMNRNILLITTDQQRYDSLGCTGTAEAYLSNFECPKINLQIRASNQEVIDFYTRQGFLKDEVINMGKRLIPDDV